MFKKLVIPFLALTITALGACSSDSSPAGGTGGKSGTGGAGTGGAGTGGAGTGGAGTGGAGTGGAGTGGAVVDAPAETAAETATETAMETAGETAPANICAAYVAGSGELAGISAADFCKEYATDCTFTGAMHYASMGDCMTSYGGTTTPNKTCRAGHLCNAKTAASTTSAHCDHAAGHVACM